MKSSIRGQFPILSVAIEKNPLIYLDNAATTQKPECVLQAMTDFYSTKNANINRGVHPLAETATVAYDEARATIANFIGAKPHEIIFTRNATEAINLVARSIGLTKKDTVALSILEHHSNIVPWMQTDAQIEWISIDADGQIDVKELQKKLKTGKVSIVAVTGLSNVLGSRPNLEAIIKEAHAHGTKVLIDAAQLAAHEAIDVKKLDCDFLAFSGHKVYGPMGIGVLYGKAEILKEMDPFLGGGDMIATVTTEGFTPAELPRKFEAGTPAVAEAIGLATALDWIQNIGMETIAAHEQKLITHALKGLSTIKELRILGTKDPTKRVGCISFVVDGVHPHDLTEVLGREGICLRAGHHCTQPLHKILGINASARLSVGIYNTAEEVDRCIEAIGKAKTFLQK